MPIFCCANEKGQPLQYNVNDEVKMPFFYCDVQAAEDELRKAQKEMKSDIAKGLGIIPFPLGSAFELMARNQAIVIPSLEALTAAGAPHGVDPLGQQVPLFACMDIMQENDEGAAVLPIFMVHGEAQKAMEEALQADDVSNDAGEEFQIVSVSLPRAVELLATNADDAPAFRFLPPRSSIDYIQKYLS